MFYRSHWDVGYDFPETSSDTKINYCEFQRHLVTQKNKCNEFLETSSDTKKQELWITRDILWHTKNKNYELPETSCDTQNKIPRDN